MTMLRISTRSGPPLLIGADEELRVLLPSDKYEKRQARLLRVGDLVQARGRVTEITPLGGAA